MARQIVFTGRKIQLAVDTTALPGGASLEREVVLHPGAVVILPWLGGERVCLLRNYRHSVGKTLLELPAGTLEPPENPEAAAIRELHEETGYRAGRWRKLAQFYPSPGILTERMFLFLAEELTPGDMRPEAGEQLQPLIVPWAQALAWVDDGTIEDAKTLAGLLLWERWKT
ncbi:MAG TPA: NUDIX hydrolase [Gemmataceae bacterium]|jgi:ADP-ribose pyrophosphatase|nr:NUDIX hydrolase [Gemmataceae bacterium]